MIVKMKPFKGAHHIKLIINGDDMACFEKWLTYEEVSVIVGLLGNETYRTGAYAPEIILRDTTQEDEDFYEALRKDDEKRERIRRQKEMEEEKWNREHSAMRVAFIKAGWTE